MDAALTRTVTSALPVHPDDAEADLLEDLARVATEAAHARRAGLPWHRAVRDPEHHALRHFHQDLADALLVELPEPVQRWAANLRDGGEGAEVLERVVEVARHGEPTGIRGDAPQPEEATALAELLVFESLRLRLLVSAWQSGEFERLGGEDEDVDRIAGQVLARLLLDPALGDDDVRAVPLLSAAAHVELLREVAARAEELRRCGPELRDDLTLRGNLRSALRELRAPESVLLGNALSALLGTPRHELDDLAAEHPMALGDLSRQAMDQRVSRGRRALTRSMEQWPRRRAPALYDLMRGENDDSAD